MDLTRRRELRRGMQSTSPRTPRLRVKFSASCGGWNRTSVRAVNSRPPVPTRDTARSPADTACQCHRVGAVGFEPTISCSRSRRISKLSYTPVACQLFVVRCQLSELLTTDNGQLTTQKSTQRESNPHIRHGKAVGCRYIMGAVNPDRNVKEQERCTSRSRIRKNAGWRPTPRILSNAASVQLPNFLPLGPEGLEPSPAWLRARHAATNTLVPIYLLHLRKLGAEGIEPSTWSL